MKSARSGYMETPEVLCGMCGTRTWQMTIGHWWVCGEQECRDRANQYLMEDEADGKGMVAWYWIVCPKCRTAIPMYAAKNEYPPELPEPGCCPECKSERLMTAVYEEIHPL